MANALGGFNGRSMTFPREVGTDEVPNFITFRPVEIDFGKFNTASTQKNSYGSAFNKSNISEWNPAGVFNTAMAQQKKSGIGGIIDNLANGALSVLNSLGKGMVNFKGDINLFGGLIQARVDIGSLGLPTGGVQQGNKIFKKPGINLYMPPELAHALTAKYQEAELGAMGMTAIDMVNTKGYYNTEGTVMAGAAESIKQMFTSLVNDIKRTGTLGAAVQRATGRVSNAYTYAIFNNMNHRNFNYSFRLIARSADDSKMIKDICDNFMYYLLPTKSSDDFHNYSVPCMWEISYNRYGAKNQFLDQPNNCFLKGVNIKYNSSGQGMTYNDGAPIDVTIDLSFMEIEPLYNTGESQNKGQDAKMTTGKIDDR
jgi:hypothetical protein